MAAWNTMAMRTLDAKEVNQPAPLSSSKAKMPKVHQSTAIVWPPRLRKSSRTMKNSRKYEIHTNIRNANDASFKTLTSQVQALIKSLWKSLCHACGSNQLGCKVVWSATSCVRFANTNLQVGNWNIPSHKSLPCYSKVNSINARNLFKIAPKSMPCLIDHVTPKPF